ncbi:MAG: CDP-diacylglycerol--glycerol-3-phosphate 3-phosphatidyltransferase [Xanthomonadales bacterium]|nr:CDP-diacylglycerol--glycerol-3-phosphate 3-phosphatidyltransferase [Xanthomonadales bacterium]
MTLNLPTVLTLLRIALIPVLVLLCYLPWPHGRTTAAWVFLAAALTDWLDGWIARRRNQTSAFGAFLDPVADKLMVATALIVLLQQDPSIWLGFLAIVIIGREISISALREWMAEVGQRGTVKVGALGKIKTIAQMTALTMMLYRDPLFTLPIYWLGEMLLAVAAVLTVWSMVQYLQAAFARPTAAISATDVAAVAPPAPNPAID